MKTPFLLSLLLLAYCSTAIAAEVQGRIISYGLYKVSGKEEKVKSPETTTGITKVPAGAPMLVAITNRIPAKVGTRFGFWYEITNVPVADGEVELTKIAKHPPIKKPDGTTATGFTFIEKQWVKSGRVFSWTGYSFDKKFELAIGEWEFEMQYKGKTVCKQQFTVYKK